MQINKSIRPKLLRLAIIQIIFLSGMNINSAFGQIEAPLTWGVNAGVTVSGLTGNDVTEYKSRAGFSLGLFLNYSLNHYLAIHPEMNYSEKGGDINPGLTGENSSATYKFGYLGIPVLTKLYIPTGSFVNPNIYVGPQLGIKLYGKSNDRKIDSQMRSTVFSLAFGTGIDFDIASTPSDLIHTIGLDLRFMLGLTNIFDMPQEPAAKNAAFTSSLYIGF